MNPDAPGASRRSLMLLLPFSAALSRLMGEVRQPRRKDRAQQQQQPSPQTVEDYVLRSHANLVVLDVAVVNASGAPVSGLARDQFLVREDGRIQAIKQFTADDAPVSLGLLLDMSGSMSRKMPAMHRAIDAFLGASNPRDEYFVVAFNDRPRFVLPAGVAFSHRREDVRAALLASRPQGRTALYDGLAAAVQHLGAGSYERRVLVLISDGKDTASALSLSAALRRVRSAPVTIYTMGLFSGAEEADETNRGVLKRIARITGGFYFSPENADGIEQACVRIARDIRARYTLAYTPPELTKSEAAAPGGNAIRKIKVELLLRDRLGPGLSVRARSEYVAAAGKGETND